MDRVLVGAVLLDLLVLAPLWLMFAAQEGNLLLIVDDPGSPRSSTPCSCVLFVAIPSARRLVLAARWLARLARRVGGRCFRAWAGAACLLLFACCSSCSSSAGAKSPAAALVRPARSITGAGGVPRRVCCAPGWPGRASRTSSGTCARSARRTAGRPRPRARRPACSLAFPERRRARRRRRPSRRAARPDAGRAVTPVERDGERVAGPDLRPVAGGRPRARRGDRGGGGGRAGEPKLHAEGRRGSPSCRPPANASSRPPTPSGGASSATCTTAPSSGWSRWRCSSR